MKRTPRVEELEALEPTLVDGEPPSPVPGTWERMVSTNRPTRSDDTTIISGGRRATLDDMLRHIEADLASRRAA